MSRSSILPWHPRRLAASERLALSLSQAGVGLHARDETGTWQEIRHAALDDAAFDYMIDEIRVETLVRAGRSVPITLWLPEEQVLVRQYLLNAKGPEAVHEARRRLAAETIYEPDDLMIALSPARRGEPTTVLAALAQTICEARDHAERWGFLPGPVSTRVAAALFGETPPVFRKAEPLAAQAMRLSVRAVGAGACVLVAGALLYAGATQLEPLFKSIEPRQTRGPVFATVRVLDEPLKPGTPQPHALQIGQAQMLGLPRVVLAAAAAESGNIASAYAAAPATDSPAPLTAPTTQRTLHVGPAPDTHAQARPGRLRTDTGQIASMDVTALREGLSRLQRDAAEPVADDPVLSKVDGVATFRTPTSIVPGAPTRKAVPEAGAPLQLASLPTAETPAPQRRKAPAPVDTVTPVPEAAPATPEYKSAFAPFEIQIKPVPRPVIAAAATPEPEEPATPAPARAPVPGPSIAAATLAAPAATAERAQGASLATLPATNTAPDAAPEAPSVFAALDAPQPRTRPKNVPVFDISPQRLKPVNVTPGPRAVRQAASQYGLLLDETSLVGIIDARSGRKALVRMPSGDFRKVGRGDDLDGWRVSSISREAVRLTKRGQNRTLLLVSR